MTVEGESNQDVAVLIKQIGQQILDEIRTLIANQQTKEFYTTEELASALDKKPFTIREHWCNAGRIECGKDENGKWRIPGHEYRRLINGGGLSAKRL